MSCLSTNGIVMLASSQRYRMIASNFDIFWCFATAIGVESTLMLCRPTETLLYEWKKVLPVEFYSVSLEKLFEMAVDIKSGLTNADLP